MENIMDHTVPLSFVIKVASF